MKTTSTFFTPTTIKQAIPKSFYHSVDFTNFARSGGVTLKPTTLCTSPWSTTLQYGGNIASALYSGLEAQVPKPPSAGTVPLRLCQFSLYFFKPVPMQDMILAPVAPLRLGNKVVHLQASLIGSRSSGDAEGVEVARAVGVFMRQQDVSAFGVTENPTREQHIKEHFDKNTVPVFGEGSLAAVPRIGGSPIPHYEKPGVGFFWASDCRVGRSMLESKPGDVAEYWMRQNVPVFEHEKKVNPMHRLLLLGEGSGGLSAYLPLKKFSFVNPVFSMTVMREPRTEWVGVRGKTEVDPLTGSGMVSTQMFDEQGVCATISQPQIVESWEQIKRKPVRN
jgi:hypothetical protein